MAAIVFVHELTSGEEAQAIRATVAQEGRIVEQGSGYYEVHIPSADVEPGGGVVYLTGLLDQALPAWREHIEFRRPDAA